MTKFVIQRLRYGEFESDLLFADTLGLGLVRGRTSDALDAGASGAVSGGISGVTPALPYSRSGMSLKNIMNRIIRIMNKVI